MGMSVGGGGGEEGDVPPVMNTTPLIDVMLVLLVMLIITIPIQTHAVKLDMPPPNPNAEQSEPPPVIDVLVDFDGTILWNGQALSGRDELEAMVKDAVKQPKLPEVHLRPNKLVQYRYVATVLATAQKNGLNNIAMAGNEQFLSQ